MVWVLVHGSCDCVLYRYSGGGWHRRAAGLLHAPRVRAPRLLAKLGLGVPPCPLACCGVVLLLVLDQLLRDVLHQRVRCTNHHQPVSLIAGDN